MGNLTGLYLELDEFARADSLAVQALTIYKQLHGDDSRWVASALNELAVIYHLQGKNPEAEPLLLQAMEIAENMQGSDHPSMARYLHSQ